MIHGKLFPKLFTAMAVVIAIFSAALYALIVPLITQASYQAEQDNGKSLLASVHMLVNEAHADLERHRTYALESRKNELRDILSLTAAFVEQIGEDVDAGYLEKSEARTQILRYLRQFQFGDKDYVWAADYNNTLIAHPDPAFHQVNVSERRDNKGRLVIPPIIEMARRDGDGFHTYGWSRLGQTEEREKISYFRDFPEWEMIIGAGLYLDDIDAVVRQREADLIADLRETLSGLKIAKTGYMFVFDSDNHMIIHPNPNIENTNFSGLLDPSTGLPIAGELIDVADQNAPLGYTWDIPSDPGNYTYSKLSWVRHAKGFDWYIASSVYVDELKRGAETIGETILSMTLAITAGALLLAFFLARWITQPVTALAAAAARVRSGDLSVKTGIQRDDEIGALASAFDAMVARLRDNIGALDQKVQERTADLEAAVEADQTTRKALAANEHRQRLILDAMPARIAYLDRFRRYRFVNRAYAEHFKTSKSGIIDQDIATVLPPGPLAAALPYMDAAYAGETQVFELHYTTPGGEVRPHKVTLIPEVDHDGGLLISSLDITEERETERRLVDAQRMQAVGALAGGLAHDFNNLLTVILGNLSEAARSHQAHPEWPALASFIDPAMRASRRGAAITGRLLAFARRQTLNPRPTDIDALLRETAVLLRGSLPKNIQIIQFAPFDPCWATIDAAALETAIVNLALNARDAMPDGGELRLRCRSRVVEEPLTLDDAVPPGIYAEITVEDTGHGFDEETRRQAFEPFFTTKSDAEGSGLGLSMVFGFTKQSNGYVGLSASPGNGAAFTLLLPAAPVPVVTIGRPDGTVSTALALGAEDTAGPPTWDGQLALLVEDDEDVRMVVRHQLTGLGFAVIEASRGDEALELLSEMEGIHLLVTDLVMPGPLDGYGLAAEAALVAPDTTVVMMTGYTPNNPSGPVLRKPFDTTDLKHAIQAAQSQTPSSVPSHVSAKTTLEPAQ